MTRHFPNFLRIYPGPGMPKHPTHFAREPFLALDCTRFWLIRGTNVIFTLGKQTFVMDRELTHPATQATGKTNLRHVCFFIPCGPRFHPSISGGTSKPNLKIMPSGQPSVTATLGANQTKDWSIYRIPFLKLRCHLKNGSWKTIVSLSKGFVVGAILVSLGVCILDAI